MPPTCRRSCRRLCRPKAAARRRGRSRCCPGRRGRSRRSTASLACCPARHWCSSPSSASTWSTSAEEVKDPQRTLPLGIFGGLALVTLLYIGVSLALTGMVPYTLLAAEENPSLATAFIARSEEHTSELQSLTRISYA